MHGHKNTCSFTIHPKSCKVIFWCSFELQTFIVKLSFKFATMSDRKRQFGGTQLCSIINLVSEIEKSTHVKLFAVHKKLENVEKRIKYSKEKTLAKYNKFRGQNKIFFRLSSDFYDLANSLESQSRPS